MHTRDLSSETAFLKHANLVCVRYAGAEPDGEKVWQLTEALIPIGEHQLILLVPASRSLDDSSAPLVGELSQVQEITMVNSQYARVILVGVMFDEDEEGEEATFYVPSLHVYTPRF